MHKEYMNLGKETANEKMARCGQLDSVRENFYRGKDMYFCIRDDDTSYFASPDDLERAYGEITNHGPVSLAIIPFCKAGTSKGIPENFKRQGSINALHDNSELVQYLRAGIAAGRYEA